MNGLKRIAPAVIVVTLFTVVFQVGFWLLMLPQFQSVGRDVAELDLYDKLGGQAAGSTPSPKTGNEPATALERQTEQVDALMPLDEKIYDLSVQVEALAKQTKVELTGLQISPAAAATTTAPKATAAPAATGSSTPAPSAAPGAANAAVLKDANLLRSRLSIGISGDYGAVQVFIGGLTRLERFITIDQIGVTSKDGGAYTVQISAQAYSYRYVQPKS